MALHDAETDGYRAVRSRRVGIPALLAILLLLPGLSPTWAGELLAIRTWPWEDRFRVVLDLSEETTHEDRIVTDPDRIAINLLNTRASQSLVPTVDDWMIERIRLNRLRDGTAQVVLDLVQAPAYKIFDLPAGDGKAHRVVCDVFRPRHRNSPDGEKPWVVVIDPGHGGRDPGAVHRRLREKEVVLDVAQRLATELGQQSGVVAHLTRRKDIFVNLKERARRSEAVEADVFISIHVNGCRSRAARGAEVFFLNLSGATDAATRELAALENAAVTETEDPMLGEIADLPFAVDLLKTDTLRRSSLLAEEILDQLEDNRLAASRGVKQANFTVLRSCRVPSTLVELGFISNPEDARRLSSPSHRQALAEAIAQGLQNFRVRYARHARVAKSDDPSPEAGSR